VAKSLFCLAEFHGQLGKVPARQILELDPFEVAPNPFVGVQLRRISGQALQAEPRGCAVGQVFLHHVAAVDGRPVPEQQGLAAEVAPQMAQKPEHIGTPEGAALHLHIQLSLGGDTADGGKVIVGQPLPQHGGLPLRGEGADHRGQQVESRLVYEDDGALLLFCLFLSAGQRSTSQLRMASSFRWLARRAGFWRLHPHARKMRPTWEG